jgi:mannose-1-phosphate guanylyltransferase/mannose-6-phosphate isomerase
VRPTRPATEYGYIRLGEQISQKLFAIDRFVEKPDAATAAGYLKEGYLWNSGNFLFSARFLIEEYRQFEPESAEAVLKATDTASTDLGFITLDSEHFARATAKSIDYAVIERTRHAAAMTANFDWSDVGSWQAVWELSKRDVQGNSARGSALFVDTKNSYVSTDKQFVALHGVDDVAVVATDDVILVTRRDSGGGLRNVVGQVHAMTPKLTEDHSTIGRPWGTYQSVDRGDRFQVKRIVVKKGGRLSLQFHHHRAEHWVVVRGTARVTVGDKMMFLHENESIYVPAGAKHRLENLGKIDLELIEVQTGSYLGEDDIVRIEDDYKRS